jgi:hypothetical protein
MEKVGKIAQSDWQEGTNSNDKKKGRKIDR